MPFDARYPDPLLVDTINEAIIGAGVTVEGMRIQDGGIYDDDLIWATNRAPNDMFFRRINAVRVGLYRTPGAPVLIDLIVRAILPQTEIVMLNNSRVRGTTTVGQGYYLSSQDGVGTQDVAENRNGRLDILRGGDIDLLDDRFIDLGNAAAGLPAAAIAHRGKLGFVEGAAGVADVLYCCGKSAAGVYSWAAVHTF